MLYVTRNVLQQLLYMKLGSNNKAPVFLGSSSQNTCL